MSSSSPLSSCRVLAARQHAERDLIKSNEALERKTEELSRANVENVSIEGHDGFIAVGDSPPLGASLCEVGIQFGDDFIEWSISFAEIDSDLSPPEPPPLATLTAANPSTP